MNICETFKNPRLPPIAIAIYKELTSHTNMPLKCPVEPVSYEIIITCTFEMFQNATSNINPRIVITC